MLGSEILELAIGLVFVFLSVSLVCTAAMEGIEQLTKGRAKDLERGIRELLNDSDGTSITKTLFDHPLIQGLFAGRYDPAFLKKTKTLTGVGEQLHMRLLKRRNLPSYIPASSFASALMDTMVRGAPNGLPYLPPTAQALSIESLREGVSGLPNGNLQRAVLSAIDQAEDDVAKAKANLEAWFDTSMERVSGWYKRRTQAVLFAMGLGVAAVMNIDAITIAQRLGQDEALRQAVVALAEKRVNAPPSDTQASNNPSDDSVAKLKADLEGIGLPIGWENWQPGPQAKKLACAKEDKVCLGSFYVPSLINVLLGWLITSLAVMLGAPFWFDLLKKLIMIRSAAKPPAVDETSAASSQPAAVPPTSQPATGSLAAKPEQVKAQVVAFEPLKWKDGSKKGVL